MHLARRSLAAAALALLLAACSGGTPDREPAEPNTPPTKEEAAAMPAPPSNEPAAASDASSAKPAARAKLETATFGAGCFWCVEAVLEQLPGVVDVRSGYMGGSVADPTYRQVCEGTTGHAEVVQVTYDPSEITYAQLLDWFWKLHDPTTPNRQGHDEGTQYRSAIFFHTPEQKAEAERAKAAAQKDFAEPIVTEIVAAAPFYEAEDYHQDYYRQNANQPYCRAVITPKLDKLGLEK